MDGSNQTLSDSDAVSTWTDLSGSGHHATAALASQHHYINHTQISIIKMCSHFQIQIIIYQKVQGLKFRTCFHQVTQVRSRVSWLYAKQNQLIVTEVTGSGRSVTAVES